MILWEIKIQLCCIYFKSNGKFFFALSLYVGHSNNSVTFQGLSTVKKRQEKSLVFYISYFISLSSGYYVKKKNNTQVEQDITPVKASSPNSFDLGGEALI